MHNPSKQLLPNGVIKVSKIFNAKAIIRDISKTLKVLHSYRVQHQHLGYIVCSGNVHESNDHKEAKKPIYGLVNGQINRFDSRYNSDEKYRNARSLVYRYVRNPKDIHKYKSLNRHLLAAMEPDFTGNNNPHAVIAHRLFKNNKAEGLFLELEKLQDQIGQKL